MKSPISELRDKKKKNEDTIEELSVSIGVFIQGATTDVLERVNDIREYVEYRMVELEIQGQEEKIAHMKAVLNLIKQ